MYDLDLITGMNDIKSSAEKSSIPHKRGCRFQQKLNKKDRLTRYFKSIGIIRGTRKRCCLLGQQDWNIF